MSLKIKPKPKEIGIKIYFSLFCNMLYIREKTCTSRERSPGMISDSLYIMMRLELAWILKERRRRRRKKKNLIVLNPTLWLRVRSATAAAGDGTNGKTGKKPWHECHHHRKRSSFFTLLLLLLLLQLVSHSIPISPVNKQRRIQISCV